MSGCTHISQVNRAFESTLINKKECCLCFNNGDTAHETSPNTLFATSTLLTTKKNYPQGGHNVCLTCWTGGCGKPHGHIFRHYDVTKHHVFLNIQNDPQSAQPSEPPTTIDITTLGVPPPPQKQIYQAYCITCDEVFDPENSTPELLLSLQTMQQYPDALKLNEYQDPAAPNAAAANAGGFGGPAGGMGCQHCEALPEQHEAQLMATLENEILQEELAADSTAMAAPRSYYIYQSQDPKQPQRRIWLGENCLPDLSTASKPLTGADLAEAEKQYPPLADGTNSYNPYQCRECDIATNLWLCMTCGYLGCARKDYDGTGGNNHAVEHSKATSHPLVIKIATVTNDSGDIWCYSCDDAVHDKDLKTHLASFNLDPTKLIQTEATLEDLQLQLNITAQFASAYNANGYSKPLVFGQGLTGIENFGNSCYLNAIAQLYFRIPNIYARYYLAGENHAKTCRNGRPGQCVLCQYFKLAQGLFSGEFSPVPSDTKLVKYLRSVFTQVAAQRNRQSNDGLLKRSSTQMTDDDNHGSASTMGDSDAHLNKKQRCGEEQQGCQDVALASIQHGATIAPPPPPPADTAPQPQSLQTGITFHALRKLLNDKHPIFGNLKQQDAVEFLGHLRDYTQHFEKNKCPAAEKIDLTTTPNINDGFAYRTQQTITCTACGDINYKYGNHYDFQLQLANAVEIVNPVETALPANDDKEKEKQYESQDFAQCLSKYSSQQDLIGFRCPACQVISKCVSTNTIFTLPQYFMVQVNRFIVNTTTWSMTKNNAPVLGTECIDLAPVVVQSAPDLAVIAAKSSSSSSSLSSAAPNSDNEKYLANAEAMVEMFMSPQCVAIKLLKQSNNDVDGASELFFGLDDGSAHEPNCDCPGMALGPATAAPLNIVDPITIKTGALDLSPFDPQTRVNSNPSTKYNLVGFVNHLGTSAQSGHYVSHIQTQWNKQITSAQPVNNMNDTILPTVFNVLGYDKEAPPQSITDLEKSILPLDTFTSNSNQSTWICFNDAKVFLNNEPPNDQAYVLLYQRMD